MILYKKFLICSKCLWRTTCLRAGKFWTSKKWWSTNRTRWPKPWRRTRAKTNLYRHRGIRYSSRMSCCNSTWSVEASPPQCNRFQTILICQGNTFKIKSKYYQVQTLMNTVLLWTSDHWREELSFTSWIQSFSKNWRLKCMKDELKISRRRHRN